MIEILLVHRFKLSSLLWLEFVVKRFHQVFVSLLANCQFELVAANELRMLGVFFPECIGDQMMRCSVRKRLLVQKAYVRNSVGLCFGLDLPLLDFLELGRERHRVILRDLI